MKIDMECINGEICASVDDEMTRYNLFLYKKYISVRLQLQSAGMRPG